MRIGFNRAQTEAGDKLTRENNVVNSIDCMPHSKTHPEDLAVTEEGAWAYGRCVSAAICLARAKDRRRLISTSPKSTYSLRRHKLIPEERGEKMLVGYAQL